MVDINADDILKILEQLGQQLTPAGQYVFQLAVRQQIIEGIVNAVLILFGWLVTLGIFIKANRMAKHDRYLAAGDLTYAGGVAVIGIFTGLIVFIGTIATMTDMATKIFNPEYAAIRDLMATLMGNK